MTFSVSVAQSSATFWSAQRKLKTFWSTQA